MKIGIFGVKKATNDGFCQGVVSKAEGGARGFFC